MLTIKELWRREGGYKALLVTAIPLILSTASWSILQFIDRMFLAWYSPAALAAAMPAGILNFAMMGIFTGTASYIGTFIAQYYGAQEYKNIGKVLWQGIYIALIGSIVLIIPGIFSREIFQVIGHPEEVATMENIYFRVLCFGSAGPVLSGVLSGFYSGRGQNWPIMWINFLSAGVNILFDYLLIFGNWGFPELGIFGAAIATVLSGATPFIIYALLLFRPHNNALYHTLSGFRFDKNIFLKVIEFGLPSGVHFFIDIAGFTGFLLIVGRLGTVELAATNIAFNINSIAFMPMIGCGIAISMLVGQNIGRGNITLAARSAWSGFQICFLYMASIALLYFALPELFLYPFSSKADPHSFKPIYDLSIVLLKFVAFYCLFDTLNIVFASAVKGAGDTKFVMIMGIALSLGVLLMPTLVAVILLKLGLYVAWGIASAYISLMGIAFLLRFLSGKWKNMKLIETGTIIPPNYPEIPSNDL